MYTYQGKNPLDCALPHILLNVLQSKDISLQLYQEQHLEPLVSGISHHMLVGAGLIKPSGDAPKTPDSCSQIPESK